MLILVRPSDLIFVPGHQPARGSFVGLGTELLEAQQPAQAPQGAAKTPAKGAAAKGAAAVLDWLTAVGRAELMTQPGMLVSANFGRLVLGCCLAENVGRYAQI